MIIVGVIVFIVVIALDVYLAQFIDKYLEDKFDIYTDTAFPIILAIILLLEMAVVLQWFYNNGNLIG